MNKKRAFAVGSAVAVSLLLAVPAFADTSSTTPSTGQSTSTTHNFRKGGMHTRAGVKGMRQKLANAAFGTVASVDGSTITLTRTMRGGTTSTVTVQTTDTTTYKKNGQADTATDLAVGQRIVAMGTKDSSGNITDATSVNIMVRPAHTGATPAATTS